MAPCSSHTSSLYLSAAAIAVVISLMAFKVFHHTTEELNLPLYRYEPLKTDRSTRLFTLQPALYFDAPIRGYLEEIDLDSRSVYESISYLCGEQAPGHEVHILPTKNSKIQEVSRLPVYPNCLAALRVLRYRLTRRRLWIDAICIDQAPSAEKSLQVKLMTDIYERADRVLVALKPDTVGEPKVWQVALLFRVMGWLSRAKLLRLWDRDEQADMRMPKPTRLTMACDTFVEWCSKVLGDTFNAPFMNRYFQRVWTVQEIAMARQIWIHYGTSTISWHDFVVAGLFSTKTGGFARNQVSKTNIFRDLTTHWDLLNGLESHFVLPDVYSFESLETDKQPQNILQKSTQGTSELALIKAKGLQAFNPKDKAYAMLWAFDPATANIGAIFDVNYEKPLEQIYAEFSTAIFLRSQGSSLQFYLVNSTPRNQALPSWVPDWSVAAPMSLFVWTERLRDFSAAGDMSRRYRVVIEGPVLRICGIEYCKLSAILRLTETSRGRNVHGDDPRDLVEALTDAAELMRSLIDVGRSHASSATEDGLLHAIHRVVHSQYALNVSTTDDQNIFHATPCEIQITDEQHISVGLLRLQVFNTFTFLLDMTTIPVQQVQDTLKLYLPDEQIIEVLSEASALPNLTPFLAVIVPLSKYYELYRFLHLIVLDHRDKDFFITDQETLGIAFQGVQAEDIVAIWEGCPSPLIVRRHLEDGEQGLKTFHLHGPAFVDALMNGEGWPYNESELIQFVVF